MRKWTLSVVFAFSILTTFCQESADSSIAYAEIINGYIYIPKSILSDEIDAVLIINKNNAASSQKKTFTLWWNSQCNDGYFNLNITPKQIYFSSSHDNPNPNYLYWVIDIDSIQFSEISKGLRSKTPTGFSNQSKYSDDAYVFHDNKFKDAFKIPEEWTEPKEKEFDDYCMKQSEQQLGRYFLLLNSFIKKENKKIKLASKEERDKIPPKLFSGNKEELLDWRPHKFVPPILNDQ